MFLGLSSGLVKSPVRSLLRVGGRQRPVAPPPEEVQQVDAVVDVVAVASIAFAPVLGDVDVAQQRGSHDALAERGESGFLEEIAGAPGYELTSTIRGVMET